MTPSPTGRHFTHKPLICQKPLFCKRLKDERYDLLLARSARANALRRAAYADREARHNQRILASDDPDEVERLKLERYELRQSNERRVAATRAKKRATKQRAARAERWRRGPRKRVLG